MTNEQPVNTENQGENKLIHLDGDNPQVNRARDINNKINLLEDSLAELQTELDTVNRSVEEGLDRLSDSDLDITAKVSETYKRLGEIDGTYKSLSKISDNIDSEVKKLTKEVEEVAVQSATELDRLENVSGKQIKELNGQHEQLVERVNNLVEESRQTSKELSEDIRKNTDTLLALESELKKEIEALASTTEARDNEIASDVDVAKKDIEQSKAKIIQMQAIDEALAKRANALEISTAELEDKTRELESSVNLLDARTSDLSVQITKLQQETKQNTFNISVLQRKAKDTSEALLALTKTEKFHFRSVTGGLILLLLLVTTLYMYQQTINDETVIATAERTQVVDQKVANLQQQNTASDAQMALVKDELVAINEKLDSDINAVNRKIVNLNDQADSLDARLTDASPFSQFGKDNIVHGPQWFNDQPANNYVIKLSTVGSKKELYELAQRYNHYLKDSLAYYPVKTGQGEAFVLTSGSYANNTDISAAIYEMPRSINFQRPGIVRIADITSYTAAM